MIKPMKKITFILTLLVLWSSTNAKVTLPQFFNNNMVLQRSKPIPIWGTANPNEKISIRFHKQSAVITADTQGKWLVKLKAENAGGPYTLTINGENTIEFKNILVGDVWLCSGQSNMEWVVGLSNNFEVEKASANTPNIRHIKILKEISFEPQSDVKETKWDVCSPETVGNFTAVGYFFAKKMYEETHVPVGLINSSWGGTNIETWISRGAFENSDEFKEMIASMPKNGTSEIKAQKAKAIENLQRMPMENFNATEFLNVNFNDNNLPSIYQPTLWENQIIGNLDGVVWLRKTIQLSAQEAAQSAILSLSMIDDEDITYVNGIKIGTEKIFDTFRKYTLPAGILKEGKNVIVIKVTDTGGGGGLFGKKEDVQLILGQNSISLAGDWKFLVEKIIFGSDVNSYPSVAYNAMIAPLEPFGLKGVLWYQGESNADRAYQYRTAFPLLINDWRNKFENKKLPFYYVNLATYTTNGNSNDGDGWCEVREAQALTLKLPNTGMVVTTDIGNPKDIHPRNKQDVGKRLANVALYNLFGKKIIVNGPTFKSFEVKNDKAIVTFSNIGTGLTTKEASKEVFGFEVAGKDQIFYPAKAIIKNNQVEIQCDNVNEPLAVRFGWLADDSKCNLFNSVNLPAVPFRTDDWKTVTKEKKYKILN